MKFDYDYQFRNSEEVLDYMRTGNAIIRLEAPSGKFYVYTFSKPVHEEDFEDNVLFVYTNDSKTGKRKYVGMFSQNAFWHTKKSKFPEDSEVFKGADFITRASFSQEMLDNTPMKIYYDGM